MYQFVTKTWTVNIPGTTAIPVGEKERIVGLYHPKEQEFIYVVCCQEVPPGGYMPVSSGRTVTVYCTVQGTQFSSSNPVEYLGSVARYNTVFHIFAEITDL